MISIPAFCSLAIKSRVIVTAECRMGFFRRRNRLPLLDESARLRSKPTSAALGEYRRLGISVHAQNIAVETAGCCFLSFWHGELDVVERGKGIVS